MSCVSTSATTVDENQAFRFLAARKFNVQEAVEQFYSYEAFLRVEGITVVDPLEENVRRELLSGKFTILNDKDPAGARVAQLFVRLHRPTRSTHKAFLQSVIFQLNAVLRKETAVRNGLILIYDMTNAKYSNFDADLSKKLFNMLKSYYPIRLRRIIVLTAPLWFRAPFHLLRVFIKEELRDRVHVLRPSPGSRLASLSNPDPATAQREHFTWLSTALTETLNPNEMSSTTSPSIRRSSSVISAFFDASTINSNTSDNSGRSSSSISSASEAGEERSVSTPVFSNSPSGGSIEDEGLMSEIGCRSPNWDPFALSSSQSSDAESNCPRQNMDKGNNVQPNDEKDKRFEEKVSNRVIDVPFRDSGGTPTPPAIPKSVNLLNKESVEGGCLDTDLAVTPTLESSTLPYAYPGGKHFHNFAGTTSSTASSFYSSVSSSLSTNDESMILPSNASIATNWLPKQAPLASQDEFVGFEDSGSPGSSNTIRKEKRYKQAGTSPSPSHVVHPSGLIPSWALHRPSGPSIHVGPSQICEPSQQVADLQPIGILRAGEASLESHLPISTSQPFHVSQSPLIHQEPDSVKDQLDSSPEDNEEEFTESDDEEDSMKLDLDGLWMSTSQLLDHVTEMGANGLAEEYAAVCSIKNTDPCTAFKRPCNSSKNRYVDVTCLEHSRVQLRPHQRPPQSPFSASTSEKDSKTQKQSPVYIHANWVDSYRQKNAFICTQGPLQETAGDFWYMIWTYNAPAVVMITRCYESQRCKCFQYWPPVEGQTLHFTSISSSANSVVAVPMASGSGVGDSGVGTMTSVRKKPLFALARRSASEVSNSNKLVFELVHVSSQPGDDYTHTKLQLKNLKSGQSRIVDHYAFHSWPDHGVPSDSSALLELLSSVQTNYAATLHRELNYTTLYDTPIAPPPIVVHCSAGIGRTGTFIALDVSTKQLLELGVVNVPLTVARIRSQRSGCVQVSAQYIFVYRALIDFAVARGLVSPSHEDAVETALSQLTSPPRPPMFLPMDASLMSALAAGGVGDTAHFSTLMRFLRDKMTGSTAKCSGGDVEAPVAQQLVCCRAPNEPNREADGDRQATEVAEAVEPKIEESLPDNSKSPPTSGERPRI
ncbi:unnamed protein product [Mesocestoides corti]|uniref:Protein-tyrosine-phosphatase n=1 Tax=Mesocestoides corti TaxID=53468 RepID=A0A3P6GPS8_MESCO|nr:unnamed protein product [Mesocestoides corti]